MQRTLINQLTTLVGKTVTLQGWVDTKRDHGKLTFIDLRDRSGVVQCVGVGKMGKLTTESVVEIQGTVRERPAEMVNSEIETGKIEVEVSEFSLLAEASELPFQVKEDGHDINEETRLKYRYLDLRRPRMQKIMRLRSQFMRELREAFYAREFVEIETPILTESTKEGARDFIVPSRFNPGKFYALPQSPQQYKQLLMTAGLERYFQLAKCIRDEDLRADRGFEFTQVDMEMSFVDREAVMQTVEEIVKQSVKAVGGKLQQEEFPVITYAEAMQKYGADKFDMRSEQEKQDGVLAFAWVVDFPFFKKVDKDDVAETRDGKSGWTFTHNPFSIPNPEFIDQHLAGENLDGILTTQYDLVCNGYEVGGGSIRSHRPDILRKTFEIMGYSEEEIQHSVGHMLKAFTTGTPPHGGIALGLDRLIMLLANESSLKETIAFPMTASGRTAVMSGPSTVSQEQLDELGIAITVSTIKDGKSMRDAILQLLASRGIKFQHAEHEETPTSEDAARVRGVELSTGVKALILKDKKDGHNVMLCVPGDRKANIKALEEILGSKLEMEKPEVILQKFGLQIGGVPPLGNLIGIPVYFDQAIADIGEANFNCGLRTESIAMDSKDLIAATDA
ncbi:hypothetical protein KC640_02630, partial [Candidatus Dojkabacteria bacterium]|nr:hypothetical protein [Candidatus Dojkabacteria bacterium]